MEVLELTTEKDFIDSDRKAMIFIHSPFCGTCRMARKMLDTIESLWQQHLFFELNASLHPGFMQENQVESVPCLLVVSKGRVKDKIYAFHSVPYMQRIVSKHVNS
ncbi:thioredoxin-like protein YusE [Thalassobacillus devorans]|uniref:Thioredoxin-like protein YusE n=1 Tax=Thalassobacillus devorans TaxID=279813 RepID=A0ABQ1NNS3_9BACI|nr:thioredoxin family protein [Thalassobacillus devorans]NIK29032.1 thiol-disulfide isomerase/thioredoxin [Thalassobacillus devorans]GGC81687.1 thioredoxin-like protein YusE [Thalassobacillus devorans]